MEDSQTIRILLIEDSLIDAQVIRGMLANATGGNFQVRHVDRLASGQQALADGEVDIVLLDLMLPDSSGLDTFRAIQACAPGVPIVVLTGLNDNKLATAAVHLGAQDFLVKGEINGNPLARSIRYAIERQRLGEELREKTALLQDSEERWRMLIELDIDAVLIVDADGIVRFANPAAGTLFGRDRQELLDRPVGLSIGSNSASEVDLTRPNGEKVVAEMHAVEIAWQGERVHMVSLRDISRRRQYEEQIRFQASLMRNLTDAVIATDLEFNVTSWNKGAEQVYGWTAEEAIGRSLSEIVPIEYLTRTRDDVIAELRKQGFWRGEVRQRSKDGASHYILASVSLITDASGNPYGVVGVNREITERIEAEAALRHYSERLEEMVAERTKRLQEAQQRLHKTFISLRDGVIILGSDGKRILECNPAVEGIFGYDREEIVGSMFARLHTDGRNMAEFCWQLREAVDRRGYLHLGDFPMRRKSGEEFPAEISVIPLEDDQGQRIGWVGVVQDIAERKQMQERLMRSERLAVLGQLTGGIGHELRNPLGAIRNGCDFLGMAIDDPDPEIRDTLAILERQVDACDRIIASLLSFTRPRPPQPMPVRVDDLLKEVLSMETIPQQIDLEFQTGADMGLVLLDPGQMSIVFSNLVRNAVQAMPTGGCLSISVSALPDSRPASGIRIRVSDSGCGISEDRLPQLFEPLFTTKTSGLGLGLALTKLLVEGHGGEISVTSVLGAGTTFTIDLPVNQ